MALLTLTRYILPIYAPDPLFVQLDFLFTIVTLILRFSLRCILFFDNIILLYLVLKHRTEIEEWLLLIARAFGVVC